MSEPHRRSTRTSVGILTALACLMAMTLAPAAAAEAVTTTKTPAELTIAAPSAPTDGYLAIGVTSFTPPRQGAVSAVVSLVDSAGRKYEVGRFSIFPSEPFVAKGPAEERAFLLDAREALRAASKGPLKVVVQLTPDVAGGEVADAALTVGRAAFTAPP
jgi:hypothetical protein